MFLILMFVFSLLMFATTWRVARSLASPRQDTGYSKTVGSIAAMAGLPFYACAAYCAHKAFDGGAMFTVLLVFALIAMAFASVLGEQAGLRSKSLQAQ